MKKIIILLMLVSSLFSANLDWPSDYDDALKDAQTQHKRVYIFVSSISCGWCKKFANTTLQDKKVLQALKKQYVLLHIVKEIDELPSNFNTRAVPKHFFLDEKGNIVYTFVGYVDSSDFLEYLKELDEEYEDFSEE